MCGSYTAGALSVALFLVRRYRFLVFLSHPSHPYVFLILQAILCSLFELTSDYTFICFTLTTKNGGILLFSAFSPVYNLIVSEFQSLTWKCDLESQVRAVLPRVSLEDL